MAVKGSTFTTAQIGCFRAIVAVLTLLILVPDTRRRPDLKALALAVVYGGCMGTFVIATRLTHAANAIFLQDTAPLFLLLLGPLVLKEPMRRRDPWLLLTILGGLLLLFSADVPESQNAPDPDLGNLVALLSGLCWAVTLMGLRQRAKAGQPTGPVILAGNVMAALMFAPFVGNVETQSALSIGGIVWLGAVQIGLAYMLLVRGLASVPALQASLLMLIEPVLNPFWAFLVHDERPHLLVIAGGAIILATTIADAVLSTRSR
jgi:drug/metabolite transporter (DMT)-like permease